MDSSHDSVGIDVPESLLSNSKEEPTMQNDTRIAVDVAKAVFEIAVSDRPGRVSGREPTKKEESSDRSQNISLDGGVQILVVGQNAPTQSAGEGSL